MILVQLLSVIVRDKMCELLGNSAFVVKYLYCTVYLCLVKCDV